MYYIGIMFVAFFKWFMKIKHHIPAGVTTIFIIVQFFVDWILATLPYAFQNLSKTLFSAELTINEMVRLAVYEPSKYTVFSFFKILISLYILYILVRFLARLQIKVTGSQAEWGAYVIGILFVAIIQISTIRMIDGKFGFIPIWDGIIYMLFNLQYVILGMFTSNYKVVTDVASNVTTNVTAMVSFLIRKIYKEQRK